MGTKGPKGIALHALQLNEVGFTGLGPLPHKAKPHVLDEFKLNYIEENRRVAMGRVRQ